MNLHASLTALTFAVGALAWTAAGETYDPALSARELPLEVTGGCLATDAGPCREDQYATRWAGRTARGDLFVVTPAACADRNGCRTWLIEKTAREAIVLLALDGRAALRRGAGAYPAVELRTELSATQVSYVRFEWGGQQYTRADTRLVYRVDGVECGTEEQCQRVAQEAFDAQDVDRAVRIFESVHRVSWI